MKDRQLSATSRETTRSMIQVQHTAKSVQRGPNGVIAGVHEVSWSGVDAAIPTSAIEAIVAQQLNDAKAALVEALVPVAVEAWLAKRAAALPEPLRGQLATDYFAEVLEAVLDGRLDAEIFGLPHSVSARANV